MKLRVDHTTTFTYDSPVYETGTEVRLTPVTGASSGQHCLDYRLKLSPQAQTFRYIDNFGNIVDYFNLLSSHDHLVITATSFVETGLSKSETPADPLLLLDYLLPSRYIAFDDNIREFARSFSVSPDAREIGEAIARSINGGFVYVTGVTGVNSTTNEVMETRQGVCQDFAHIMIGVSRILGFPARYISGYLYGGAESEGTNRASHAWCEVYCGKQDGWVGFDPTHETIFQDDRYIKLGSGRDYSDVPPVRGTYKGVAAEQLSVTVHISDTETFGTQG